MGGDLMFFFKCFEKNPNKVLLFSGKCGKIGAW